MRAGTSSHSCPFENALHCFLDINLEAQFENDLFSLEGINTCVCATSNLEVDWSSLAFPHS